MVLIYMLSGESKIHFKYSSVPETPLRVTSFCHRHCFLCFHQWMALLGTGQSIN